MLLPAHTIRKALLSLASLPPHAHLLEIGCGTGGFTLLLAQQFPHAMLHATDTDKNALHILKNKIVKHKIENSNLHRQSSASLSFNPSTFDTVYASLLFCNLNEHEKHQTLLNVKRVLKPHGKFFIAEWGKPKTCWAKTGFQLLKWIGGSAHLKILDNGLFPDYLHRHNFLVHEKHFINTAFGTIYFYVAE